MISIFTTLIRFKSRTYKLPTTYTTYTPTVARDCVAYKPTALIRSISLTYKITDGIVAREWVAYKPTD